jgi:protein-tyrosine phosphatase
MSAFRVSVQRRASYNAGKVELDDSRRERILFVCTANVDRSRTAEDLYRDDPRYEVRSAGVAPFATVRVTRDLLLWADRVFVMSERDDQHRTLLRIRFPDLDRPTVDLDVPDRWLRGDPELKALLLRRLRAHLGPPSGR